MLVRAAIATHPMPTVTRRRYFTALDGCSVERRGSRTPRCSTAPPPFRRGLRFARTSLLAGHSVPRSLSEAVAPRDSRSASSLATLPASPPPHRSPGQQARTPRRGQVVLTDRGDAEALEREPLGGSRRKVLHPRRGRTPESGASGACSRRRWSSRRRRSRR